MTSLSSGDYASSFAASLADPAGFWGGAAELVDWVDVPTTILDDRAAPLYRWFGGGRLNTCFNAVDRHVLAGRGAQLASAMRRRTASTRMKGMSSYQPASRSST